MRKQEHRYLVALKDAPGLKSQESFAMAGENEGWAKLACNLKAEIDEDLIEACRGTVSLPFAAGEHRRIAVKIVDDRGIESLKVIELEEQQRKLCLPN